MLVARRPAGPEWKPIMGARVLFAPIDRAMLRRARKAALRALSRDEHGPDQQGGSDQANSAEQLEELGDALSYALLVEGVKDWEDVCLMADDQDSGAGELLPFSAENLALVLCDPITFEAFDAAYVVPFAARERAKNGSAASPSGTGGAETRASGTVSSPAPRKRKAAATSAPIGSRRPKTRKPKASGTF